MAEHQGTKQSSLMGLPQSGNTGCGADPPFMVPVLRLAGESKKHVGNCTVTRFSQKDC